MFLAVLFAIIKNPGRSSELSSEQQHSLAPNMHARTHTHTHTHTHTVIPQASLQNHIAVQQNLKTCDIRYLKEINIHFKFN